MSSIAKQLINEVKQQEFYVPRNYQTMGGIWTVDSYVRGAVRVQVMDEGYTTKLIAPSLEIVAGYNGKEYVNFVQGNEEIASQYLAEFAN